jgi:negative regulator of flagellin synthesis FlgM
MKVQGSKPLKGQEITVNIQKTPKATGTEGKEQVQRTNKQSTLDRVDISRQGKEVASLMASINSLPELREDKVQQVKEAINSGTYKIDPMKVAEKMLSEI